MCLWFGLGPAPWVFTKLFKNSSLSPEKNQHQSDHIYGRYVDFKLHYTRSSHESRHSQISSAEFGLYNKYKEINFASMSENKISCQNLLRRHSTTLLELNRVIGLLSSTIQAVEPAKIQLRFLQQQEVVCLREKMNYQSVITLNTKSRSELTWWIENSRFYNGQTFSQLNSQMIC